LAQDSQNKETHERKNAQLLENKKSSFSPIDSILINFTKNNGEDFLGMQIGEVSCQATFLQKMDLGVVEGRFDSVTPTSHPMVLNLIGNSVHTSHVFLHYEMPGMRLTEIRQTNSGSNRSGDNLQKGIQGTLSILKTMTNTA
jgi:hypothetical protein